MSRSGKNSLPGDIATGNEDAFAKLCSEYKPLVDSMTETYSVIGNVGGTEKDDLRQEATIALYKAALAYKGSGGVSFGLYAKICIGNAIVSYLRRNKNRAGTIPIEDADTKGSLPYVEDDLIDNVITAEDTAKVRKAAEKMLSPYEKKVFELYVAGMSVKEIAHELGKSEKSSANAVFRIKSKIKQCLDETS